MINPLIISILGYLRKQNSSCSLVDLVALCQQDFRSLILKDVDAQVVIFQKNFFVMNALYQIQRDIQTEGFLLTIFPLEICLIPNCAGAKNTLTTRDTDLAHYYLDWSNLNNITVEEVETLFSSFWQRYRAVDDIDAALTTLGLDQGVDWLEIRQAYQKKIIISHPDKGGCADDFIETRAAYEILRYSYHRT
ncbi:DNA-J related domain-containing protein [Colwellia psychrerythraea]|uniref:DNA-J-related protein domain-containing protein n=1 Tax=Colwellia psychrerythraea TaxID=28229 RepID=A0A099KL85_COLPS|nr:DNA-J related domain-containing protein [Colwellia psychrerythraea]KGJ90388.1 DNA-J-related protein domain-containing protein [Colwellia psychrerythraea]